MEKTPTNPAKRNKGTSLIVVAAALVVITGIAIYWLIIVPANQRAFCHREYGFNQRYELGCIIKYLYGQEVSLPL